MEELEVLSLVRRAQSGERDSLNSLVSEIEPTVFGIVLRRLRNRAEALEVTQEVLLQIVRKLAQLREVERFFGWVRRIAVRMAINRSLRGPQEVYTETETLAGFGTASGNPLDRMLELERADDLREGLSHLRELDRQTLVAFYFEGRSLQEMSREFSSPVGTIKRRLHMARNRLRDQLSKLQPAG